MRALSTLKIGLDILMRREHVQLDHICGHGGRFKSSRAGQQILADAISVSVMPTAGEGGRGGMALLTSILHGRAEGRSLETFLADCAFAGAEGGSLASDPAGVVGFEDYMKRYVACLPVEKAATKLLNG